MLSLSRLRLLRELHSKGTIAAVAAALSYSPSAVSRQLTELQREAGTTLFERDGRRLRLTGAAHVLVRHADALLALSERAEAEMAAVAGQVGGVLRVAAFQTASINLVAPALGAITTRHPALRVEIVEAEPEDAVEALTLREVDVALWDEYEHVPQPRPPGLVFDLVHVEPVHLVVPRDRAPAPHPPDVQLADVQLVTLADAPWAAGRPGSSHRRLVDHICSAHGGYTPDVRHESTDLLVLLALVGAGQACTFLPHLAGPERDPAVHVCGITGTAVHRRIFAVTRADSAGRPALTVLLDALREAAPRRR